MTYDYSKTNKANLTKLRDYLAALPKDYENLEMSCFAKNSSIAAKINPRNGVWNTRLYGRAWPCRWYSVWL